MPCTALQRQKKRARYPPSALSRNAKSPDTLEFVPASSCLHHPSLSLSQLWWLPFVDIYTFGIRNFFRESMSIPRRRRLVRRGPSRPSSVISRALSQPWLVVVRKASGIPGSSFSNRIPPLPAPPKKSPRAAAPSTEARPPKSHSAARPPARHCPTKSNPAARPPAAPCRRPAAGP